MGRWLVILSLTVAQYPDIAVAASKSSDIPLWKRLLSALTPAPRPVSRDRAQPLGAVATSNSREPVAGSWVREPTNPTGPGAGCNGGQRVISAFYSQGQRTASGQPFDP